MAPGGAVGEAERQAPISLIEDNAQLPAKMRAALRLHAVSLLGANDVARDLRGRSRLAPSKTLAGLWFLPHSACSVVAGCRDKRQENNYNSTLHENVCEAFRFGGVLPTRQRGTG